MRHQLFIYITLIILLIVIIWPIALYLYYVKIDKFDGLDYSNVYEIEWNNCETGKFLGTVEELMGQEDTQQSTIVGSTCNSICGVGTFKVVYLDNEQAKKMSNIKKVYKAGYWCFPEEVSKCNLNNSLLIYTEQEKVECISKYPSLLQKNKIVGCSPDFAFKDYLTNITYSNVIPNTLRIDDLDELLIDGSYRWQCVPNKNATYPYLGDRFTQIESVCRYLSKSVNSKGPFYKFNNSFKCECDHYVDNNEESLCTDCTSGWGIVDEVFPQLGSKKAHNFGIDCIDPNSDNSILAAHIKLPCGLKTLQNIIDNNSNSDNEKRESGCIRGFIDATNTYTPQILELINK